MPEKRESTEVDVLQSRIGERAYALWEAAGKPEGCQLDHWLQAEAEIKTASDNWPSERVPSDDLSRP